MTLYIAGGTLICNKDLRIVFSGGGHDTKIFAGDTDISHMLTGISINIAPGRGTEIALYASATKITGELLAKKKDDDTQAPSS